MILDAGRLLRFYSKKKPWPDVEKYLLEGPLRLDEETLPSGP